MIKNALHNISLFYQHPELLIENVVDSLRSTSNILSIVDNGDNTYTFTVDEISNYVIVNDIVSFYGNYYITISNTAGFDNKNQLISDINIANKTFKISKTSGITIPTIFGTYKSNAPYYNFNKWLGERKSLSEMDLSKIYNNEKFPLIFLLLDIHSQVLDDLKFYASYNLQLNFIFETKRDYTIRQRKFNIYIPYIYPMYNDFMNALIYSSYVDVGSNQIIPHNSVDRYFLGTQDVNQNKINALVDVKEITFNDLKFNRLNKLYC